MRNRVIRFSCRSRRAANSCRLCLSGIRGPFRVSNMRPIGDSARLPVRQVDNSTGLKDSGTTLQPGATVGCLSDAITERQNRSVPVSTFPNPGVQHGCSPESILNPRRGNNENPHTRLDFPGGLRLNRHSNPAQLFLLMANAEHLALLQQGAAIWNDWRKRNPASLPDLRQADLIEANLSQADLSEASLIGAYAANTTLRADPVRLRKAKVT
jgi:hypothetical protein